MPDQYEDKWSREVGRLVALAIKTWAEHVDEDDPIERVLKHAEHGKVMRQLANHLRAGDMPIPWLSGVN
jgi:hypothetical protein